MEHGAGRVCNGFWVCARLLLFALGLRIFALGLRVKSVRVFCSEDYKRLL